MMLEENELFRYGSVAHAHPVNQRHERSSKIYKN